MDSRWLELRLLYEQSIPLTMGRTTITDADGNFRVSGLEAGLYTVFAVAAGIHDSFRRIPNAQPTYYRIGDSVRLELVRGGVITGTVTNGAGRASRRCSCPGH